MLQAGERDEGSRELVAHLARAKVALEGAGFKTHGKRWARLVLGEDADEQQPVKALFKLITGNPEHRAATNNYGYTAPPPRVAARSFTYPRPPVTKAGPRCLPFMWIDSCDFSEHR